MSYSDPGRKSFEYEWCQCSCCPYGYHIDLDFVRYCESICQSERTSSVSRRKDRRRQRQSMDVLLGLIPSSPSIQEKPHVQSPTVSSTLSDAVFDFERTLQRTTKNALSSNLPDVAAVSGKVPDVQRSPSVSSLSTSTTSASSLTILPYEQKDFDVISLESNGLSPAALQSVREQMALSLKRTKQLEEQVRAIPELKSEIDRLRAEKSHLAGRLQLEQVANSDKINGNDFRKRGEVPRKDAGVNCAVLTRSVGVGKQTPTLRTVSTNTLRQEEKSFNKQTQTFAELTHAYVGPDFVLGISDVGSQTNPSFFTAAKSCTAVPQVELKSTQVSVEMKSMSTSTNSFLEEKNNRNISLADLSAVEVKEEPKTTKSSVGCQYERSGSNKSTQHEIKLSSKGCQNSIRLSHKSTQPELIQGIGKNTDTVDLIPLAEISTNTAEYQCPNCAKEKEEAMITRNEKVAEKVIQEEEKAFKEEEKVFKEEEKVFKEEEKVFKEEEKVFKEEEKVFKEEKSNKEEERVIKVEEKVIREEEKAKKDDHAEPQPSRIPRLNERKKFERQITYTKIPSSPNASTSRLSGLDLTGKGSKPEEEERFPIEDDKTPKFEKVSYGETQRKKARPSKEMQAAMKVLNDSLQKGHARNIENQVKSAVHIILQEWFKVSSLVTADPHDVEDYLDSFEEVSSGLLEYVVNMVDASGNTAMHYAVSHGNFDVVSILLDSKVCDIDKQNKAGYTSVMLVSLAEVRSATDGTVVKRLFSLADVNVRAKQHGQTALMLAVSHGRLDMVAMLLEAGADVNIQDEDGSTALMCAAEHGHVEIVKYFLSQPDCDSGVSDVDGSTALKIAMEAGHRHIGVLLYAHQRSLAAPAKPRKCKSASASPRAPSSPLVTRKHVRTTNK